MALTSKTWAQLAVIAWLGLQPATLGAVTPPLPAQPSQYVVDLAGVLSPDTRARLNARLRDLEARTTAQVVVLTVNSLEGEQIEDFSHQTAVKWGIGQKGKDNGVLLTVAVKDHKYRIEVGYGLESVLPDSLVGGLGRQYLVPNFRKGDFAGGIVAAVNELAKIIGGEAAAAGEAAPARQGVATAQKRAGSPVNLTAVLFFIFILLFTINIFRNIFRKAGKGGGGGFFWFGGGGGGDFGGGGASGDW